MHENPWKMLQAVSNVPPIREFEHERAVFDAKRIRQIIVGIHNEEIGCGAVTPLQASIQIDIVLLLVVLRKGGKE